jgi:hypothetical protein
MSEAKKKAPSTEGCVLLPDPPCDTQDELGKRAGTLVQSLASTIQDLVSLSGEMTTAENLGQLLADLRDHKQDVARAFDEVELLFLGVAGEKKIEVPNVGLFEVKSSVRRTQWAHDDLFRSVIARLADEPGLLYDEDGVRLPPAAMAANVVARLRDVLSPSWKITGLRNLGLDPDEYAQTDEQHWSVKLPPRSEAA